MLHLKNIGYYFSFVYLSPYLSVGAPALGEAKGLMKKQLEI